MNATTGGRLVPALAVVIVIAAGSAGCSSPVPTQPYAWRKPDT